MGICNHFALFWCITRRITVTDFWCFCGKQTRTDHVRFFVLLHLFKCGHTRTAFCSSGDINDRIRFKFSIGDAFCFLPHKIKRLFSILFYQESHTKNRLKILSVILQKLFFWASGSTFIASYDCISEYYSFQIQKAHKLIIRYTPTQTYRTFFRQTSEITDRRHTWRNIFENASGTPRVSLLLKRSTWLWLKLACISHFQTGVERHRKTSWVSRKTSSRKETSLGTWNEFRHLDDVFGCSYKYSKDTVRSALLLRTW